MALTLFEVMAASNGEGIQAACIQRTGQQVIG